MTEIEYRISDLINFSSQQKPIDFENAFNSLMVDRLATAIDSKKLEVAQSMFSGDEQETDSSEEEEHGEAA